MEKENLNVINGINVPCHACEKSEEKPIKNIK